MTYVLTACSIGSRRCFSPGPFPTSPPRHGPPFGHPTAPSPQKRSSKPATTNHQPTATYWLELPLIQYEERI